MHIIIISMMMTLINMTDNEDGVGDCDNGNVGRMFSVVSRRL